MSKDDVFRQTRSRVGPEDVSPRTPFQGEVNPMERVRQVHEAVAADQDGDMPPHFNPTNNPDSGFAISGKMPAEFQQALQRSNAPEASPFQQEHISQPQNAPGNRKPTQERPQPKSKSSDELEDLLERLNDFSVWEEIDLPSKGKFYDSIPPTLHVRPMTGEEEQILATPRYVRKGKAIDMIFKKCVREPIDPTELLSIDRTYLLIFLRGISYTPEYDVEIKCPECSTKFSHMIDLNALEVEHCPDDFNPSDLSGVLPTTQFRFQYHLASGEEDNNVNSYRERLLKEFGDNREDDTLLYRTALLLDYIEGVKDTKELTLLLKKLPMSDISYLRSTINDPPFGVDTKIGIPCPHCTADFEIDLPFENSFFFPRKKKEQIQA